MKCCTMHNLHIILNVQSKAGPTWKACLYVYITHEFISMQKPTNFVTNYKSCGNMALTIYYCLRGFKVDSCVLQSRKTESIKKNSNQYFEIALKFVYCVSDFLIFIVLLSIFKIHCAPAQKSKLLKSLHFVLQCLEKKMF